MPDVSDPRVMFFASCPRGLEPLLCDELKQSGAHAVTTTAGGAEFSGPFELCYRVNLDSRIASRVLWRVFHGRYKTEHDIYRAAFHLPWADWFSARRTIKVKVSAQRCPLPSLDFITLKIKDAVCDAFRASTGARPDVDTHRPDIRIDAYLARYDMALYVDTSGDALFKRGFRKAGTEAPLRENLAAGILQLCGWTGKEPLLDPMCGGGTLLVEAAQMAQRVAPGLGRRFAFERLHRFDPHAWDALCKTRRAQAQPRAPLEIYGSDLRQSALRAARTNLEAAGLAGLVKLQRINVLDLEAPAEHGILVTNPPYGVRTGEQAKLAEFYPRLGDRLKQRFAGWRVYLFSADQRLPKLIRLAPSRRTPLFNGALECRLFEFKMVEGLMRKARGATSRPRV